MANCGSLFQLLQTRKPNTNTSYLFEELAEGVTWLSGMAMSVECCLPMAKVVIVDDGGTYTFFKREFEEYDLTIPSLNN